MEEVLNAIGSFGFPIAITLFLLVERGKTLKELTIAINNLSLLIQAKLK